MKQKIISILKEDIELKNRVLKELPRKIEEAAKLIIDAFRAGKKVLIFGNGGSAADAQHMACELVGRYKKERKALPAIALTTDTSILTAVSNDYSFEVAFSRQIEALGNKGDIAFGISTSGNSKNVIKAVEVAKEKGLKTIGLLGCDGGRMKDAVDLPIIVGARSTPRIQESHIVILHIICELVEEALFGR